MITPSPTQLQPEVWQKELAQAVSDPAELLKILELPPDLLESVRRAARSFPLRVTHHYLSLIRHADPADPLLRQILPLDAENHFVKGFTTDPVGDHAAALGAGILHKYAGRALLITTGACAIHCRYCFRRHYPYGQDNAVRHWDSMLQTLRTRPQINEVILSGGDPLSLSDQRLAQLVLDLEQIQHLKRLRIHTRLPLVLPSRITSNLLKTLSDSPLHCSIVLHCNHPNELAEQLRIPLNRLRQGSITLLNQAVLLRGVNDSLDIQVSLSERLFEFGVLPYYLHLLDPVAGAAHFAVPDELPAQIALGLENALPGYLVPKIVREIPGTASKTPLHRWSNPHSGATPCGATD